MAYISKITLPNGQVYDIKDVEARQLLSQGLTLEVVSTLPAASATTMGKLYLVPHTHEDSNDTHDEFVTIRSGVEGSYTYRWEKIGNTDIDLSGYSLKTHTHSVTTEQIAVGATKSKLVKAKVRGVSGSTSASKATAGTAKQIAKAGTAKSIPNVTGNTAAEVTVTPNTDSRATGALGAETATQGANTPMWGAQVSGEVLSFTFKPLETGTTVTGIASATTDATKTTLGQAIEVTPAVDNGEITPYSFQDVTVPVANAAETDVATGEVAANGTGAEVATGNAETKTVVTSVGAEN